jgi:RNase P/RNase MRP subunit POP5
MRLKTLPSIKDKKRYVFFEILSSESLEFPEVKNSVMNSLLNWLGEKAFASAKPRVIRNLWNSKERRGIIQCSHKFVNEVKTGLALIHQIGDHRVIFRTLRVSGTIKSGKKKKCEVINKYKV